MKIAKIKIEYVEINVKDNPRNKRVVAEIDYLVQKVMNVAEEIEWQVKKLEVVRSGFYSHIYQIRDHRR